MLVLGTEGHILWSLNCEDETMPETFRYERLSLKSNRYKKLAPNALRFLYQDLKSCKSHEKNETKNIRPLFFSFLTNRFNILMFCCFVFHVVCKLSNFNKWIPKHLAQASYTEFTLSLLHFGISRALISDIGFWVLKLKRNLIVLCGFQMNLSLFLFCFEKNI